MKGEQQLLKKFFFNFFCQKFRENLVLYLSMFFFLLKSGQNLVGRQSKTQKKLATALDIPPLLNVEMVEKLLIKYRIKESHARNPSRPSHHIITMI